MSCGAEKLTNMSCDTEKLIENVRENPILYDLTHSDYKNIKKKDKIWDEIALTMGGTTGDELKKKWKNLRDSYSKYLRGEKTKTGQETKILDRYKTWPWAQQMEFLRVFLQFAKTHSNISLKLSEPINKQSELFEGAEHTEQKDQPNQSPQNSVGEIQQPVQKCDKPTDKSEQKKKRKLEKVTAPLSSAEQVISYLDRRNNSNNGNTNLDEVDLIFQGYAKTVKKISAIIRPQTYPEESSSSYYTSPPFTSPQPGFSGESNQSDQSTTAKWYENFGNSLPY